MTPLSYQLINDHAALDQVLNHLQTAVQRSDLETAHAKLDLFWARLAVHIRAEHLHLFPAVVAGSGAEAKQLVTVLRQDHEFFMHELARAVETMRHLLTITEHSEIQDGLRSIDNRILEVRNRLVKHNEVEESQVYRWATTLLSPDKQALLAERITRELENLPSRFTENTWSDT